MSIKVMSQAWDESKHSGGKLLVLLALADYANDQGVCWPRVEDLATKARLSERHCQRVLRELEESGEIKTLLGGFLAGKKRANTYHVLLGKGDILTPTPEGDIHDTKGDADDRTGVTPTPPQPSIEPSVETEPSKPIGDGDAAASLPGLEPPADQIDVAARAIFERWQDICDRRDADFTPSRLKAGRKAARESLDLDEWTLVIKGFKIFRERKADRDGKKPGLEFTEIVATHPGSGDLRSRMEFFKEQDDGTVHHDAVPSLLHERITRRQIQVVEMYQQPDSDAVRERGEAALEWLRDNASLEPVRENDGRVTWRRLAA